MAFLAPFFLAGLAAIALPVLLHLRKNKPKQTIAFSSLMFLEPSPPTTKRRSRLQDLVLLALRCLGMALLIFAFARPFLPASESVESSDQSSALHLLLIDTSASMQGDRFEKSLDTAREMIHQISENDAIAVATFSDEMRPLLSPTRAVEIAASERKSSALTAVDSVKPGWAAAKLGSCLLTAAATATEAAGTGRAVKIHMISDLKKGASTEAVRGEDWSDSLQIIRHSVDLPERWTNAGIHVLANDRVRISNAEGSSKSDFKIRWSGIADEQSITVAPGESAIIDAPADLAADGIVELTGDDFPFDNTAAWAHPIRPIAKIRYLGSAKSSDSTNSLFFLSRAMQPTDAYEIEIGATVVSPDLAVASGTLTAAEIESFTAQLKSGGNGLFTLKDPASAEALAKIIGIPAGEILEAVVKDYALLGEIDFTSSIFAPFADPRYSDFSSVRFWKYRVLPASMISAGKVLAKFDSGDPAWLQFSIGKGTLHVLTSTWRPIDSQLALSPKFPPLLHALLSQSPALTVHAGHYEIGDPIPLPLETKSITLPDGSSQEVETVFKNATLPGIYRAGNNAFAVQIAASESEITPMSEAELRSLGLPLDPAGKSASQQLATTQLSNIEQENRQRLGWWLLIAAVAVFLIETVWAARRRPIPAAA